MVLPTKSTLRTQREGSAKQEWVVKIIKGKRTDLADNIEFLVDWSSNYDETWETDDNFRHAQGHIDQYLNRAGRSQTESHKKKSSRLELCFAIVAIVRHRRLIVANTINSRAYYRRVLGPRNGTRKIPTQILGIRNRNRNAVFVLF